MALAPGRLVLEDGTVFQGQSFGFPHSIAGEVVFNTGMVGYPEALTDPSYKGQVLVFTYPLIGNYGVPAQADENGISSNFESSAIQVQAVIVSEFSENMDHWNADMSFQEWLIKQKIPALCGIDTRALTKRIREKGVMLGKVVIDKDVEFYNPDIENLVAQVSTKKVVEFGNGSRKIIALDCGIKNNILRLLLKHDVCVKVVPWDYDFSTEFYDGLFISNGPGNPKMCVQTIENIKNALTIGKPIFGICLGHQLLALAAGGDTYKLKYGHRGQNQPCVDSGDRCYVTSQNHGFAVDLSTLPDGWRETFKNINDGTNEGIECVGKPFFSVQFHPEGSCGPQDTAHFFDEFMRLVHENAK